MIAIQRGARREKHGKKWERRNWINDMKKRGRVRAYRRARKLNARTNGLSVFCYFSNNIKKVIAQRHLQGVYIDKKYTVFRLGVFYIYKPI